MNEQATRQSKQTAVELVAETPATTSETSPAKPPVATKRPTSAKFAVSESAAPKSAAPKSAGPKAASAKASPAATEPSDDVGDQPNAADTKVVKTKPKKIKMVRDSFTFPSTEHARLLELKKRVIALGHEIKKGELIRIGIALIATMNDKQLLGVVSQVEKLKTGRPKQ